MISRIGIAIGLLLPLLASAAAQQAPGQPLWMYGIGQKTCIYWIGNPRADEEVRVWLIGYWTGMNRLNEQNHKPGSADDGYGVSGQVRKGCLAEPTKRIIDVAAELYARTSQGP